MARTIEELSAEIDDAYDHGDFDHAKHLERDLAHMERVDDMAERMRRADYEEWEITEEVEQARSTWDGIKANTASMRRTGTFIPTEPRIDIDPPKPEPGSERPKAAPAIDDDGLAVPPMPAAELLEGYRGHAGNELPSDLTACWAWLGDEKRLCIELSFMQKGSRGILRSTNELCLRAGWPDGAWSGDVIDSDGWHDLEPAEAASIAEERGLEGFRAYAVARATDDLGHGPNERPALANEAREARQASSALAQGPQAPKERAQAR